MADILGSLLLAAIGLGFAFVPVTIAAVTGTKPHEAGLASGLINTSQQVGGALGLAILATIANSRTQSLLHSGVHNTSVALTKGFDRRAFLVGVGFAIGGALLAAFLISSRDSRDHSNAARSEGAAAAPVAGGLAGAVCRLAQAFRGVGDDDLPMWSAPRWAKRRRKVLAVEVHSGSGTRQTAAAAIDQLVLKVGVGGDRVGLTHAAGDTSTRRSSWPAVGRSRPASTA